MSNLNPYNEALQFIRRNPGTGGAGSLAKLVLSLYNELCSYAVSECISNLDSNLTDLAFRMIHDYADRGETQELRDAGKELAIELYPRLWEMGIAMRDAREQTRDKWRREEQEKEAAEITAAEASLIKGEQALVPLQDAKRMIGHSNGLVYAYYHQGGNWYDKELNLNRVIDAIPSTGSSLTNICPESSYMLAVQLDNRLYYIPTDYDAREEYLASQSSNAG